MPSQPSGRSFRGEIQVAARIIDYLSSGLYQTPAACLKELVNNSFDADAKNVRLFVKPDADRIIIEDDGEGINRQEFQKHFRRIAESHKRDSSQKTKSGRRKIGKIGIGFIAANELCEKMEIFSTKRGSTELLHVTIDFQELRKSPEQRRRKNNAFVKADYSGNVLRTDKGSHYTHIFLQDIRGGAQAILAGLDAAKKDHSQNTLYGKSLPSTLETLKDPTLNTWKDFDTYSDTLLQIAVNVPVRYLNGWLPSSLKAHVKEFEQRIEDLHFTVMYDGMEIRKPIVFSPDKRAFIRPFEFKGKHISATGYFYAQHGAIKPIELQGLLVRIREAAVGGFDQTFWDFSQSEYSLIQTWVSCEIWADDRLEDAMNIDRRTLRTTHPSYIELQRAIHDALRETCSEARSRIYESGSAERRSQKSLQLKKEISEVAEAAKVSGALRKEIIAKWKKTTKRKSPLLRKYSVAEFYQIVIAICDDILTPKQSAQFLKKLTERLGRE